MEAWPKLGCGVGLRPPHFRYIIENRPDVDWFEIVSENFMDTGGRPNYMLDQIREHYPIVMHGVSMSIGSADPLDKEYLKKLKALADRIKPPIIADHLCWTGVDGQNLHDLLPLPQTKEAVHYVAHRIKHVQDFLGQRILIENVSSYVGFRHSTMPEWEFISNIAQEADCGILLDINNVYVNAFNHKFDAYEYIGNIPIERVGQFHLAGHTNKGTFLFDTHDCPVIHPVWELYKAAIERFGLVSSLLEWDAELPDFQKLQQEVDQMRNLRGEGKKKMYAVA